MFVIIAQETEELEESENKIPRQDTPSEKTVSSRRVKRLNAAFFMTWFIVFAFWVVFSGRFDVFHIILGIISSTIVALISGDLMFSSPATRDMIFTWLRFLRYIPWLLYQILRANLHVMYLVFHPRMMELINPQIITFDSRLTSDYSRTTFANSITLTPGTITVSVSVLGKFSVHCIDEKSGEALPGEMEQRIAGVFGE